GGIEWQPNRVPEKNPAQVQEAVLVVRKRSPADVNTARRPVKKCAQRCTTCARASTKSRTASRPSQLGFPRHGKKAQRYQRRRLHNLALRGINSVRALYPLSF